MKKKFNPVRLIQRLFGVGRYDYFNSAIIVAAGLGTRMNADKTKQLMTVCGMPVLARTAVQFERCKYISEIIIVARRDEFSTVAELVKKYGLKKVTHIVAGGDTRQQSVLNGLSKVSRDSEFVSIHDGVRCLITPRQIEQVCLDAYRHGCATAGAKAKDSVKIANDKGFIKESSDRDYVWLAQTPQIFETNIYRAAALSAAEKGITATDDNTLVEKIGFKIFLSDIGYDNLKITTTEDIFTAESILKFRGDSEQL